MKTKEDWLCHEGKTTNDPKGSNNGVGEAPMEGKGRDTMG